MRLVHLADYGGPYSGSFIPVVVYLLDRARHQGWEVEAVFTPIAVDRPWLEELEKARIPYRFSPDASRATTLIGWVKDLLAERDGPTILHTHFTRFDVPALVAGRLRPDTRLVWHLHSPLAATRGQRVRSRLKYAALGRGVDAIICVASNLEQALIERGVPRKKMSVLPNAIDTDRFPLLTTGERAKARVETGLPSSATVLLHLGWDWERKGGPLFVEAVRLLRAADGQSILGITLGDEAPARELLTEEDRFGGVRVLEPTEEIRTLYAAADVLMAPSRAEGQPYAVMEALTSGTPVVASDIAGHTLVAEGVKACRIMGRYDSAALVDGARALLERSTDQAEDEARAGRASIVDRFSLAVWSEQMMDIYRRLAPERAAG